jgi:hypothetical protein
MFNPMNGTCFRTGQYGCTRIIEKQVLQQQLGQYTRAVSCCVLFVTGLGARRLLCRSVGQGRTELQQHAARLNIIC